MSELCVKVHSIQMPANLKKTCDTGNENEIVKQLTEKMHKLKFRLLDIQNKNQMLRKELKIASKVLCKEMPTLWEGCFTGHEEEAVYLRKTIAELQRQIEEIDLNYGELKDLNFSSQKEVEQKAKYPYPSKKQSSTEKLVGCCIELKAKLNYWKNRNSDLEKQSVQLRLELDRLLQKGDENSQIHREYGALERELRARQSEKLDLRCKLDTLKTKNVQLCEELKMLKDDCVRIRSKTVDDNVLLEALTSQQRNFQDLIERHRMLSESDHRHFRDDLRDIHVNYITSCHILEQLEETAMEKDSTFQELQNYKDLLTYVKEEIEEKDANGDQKLPEVETENVEAAEELEEKEDEPLQPPDPELWEECDRLFEHFESTQEQVEQLADTAINNNNKLSEWHDELRKAKAALAQKNAELLGLQETIKILENLASSKPTKLDADRQASSATMDELLIKLDIEKEVHQFMANYWNIVVGSLDTIFQIYTTGYDRTTKIFIDSIRERKNSFKKQTSMEETASDASEHVQKDQQSSKKVK